MSDDLADVFGQSGEEWKAPSEENFAKKASHCLVEGVDVQVIADEFGVSISTVHRWSFNESLPVAFMRETFMQRLENLLQMKNESE